MRLDGPIVHIWDNLNVHTAAELREFAASRDWLTIYYLPPCAPDLNPVEGIWSLPRRGWLFNVAFSTPEHLVQRIRRGLRHIQYRSDLIDGCLAETGLTDFRRCRLLGLQFARTRRGPARGCARGGLLGAGWSVCAAVP